MAKERAKFSWELIPIYMLLGGGVIATVVYLTSSHVDMDVALALTLLFLTLGGLAYGFSFIPRAGWGWRIPAAIGWIAALVSLVVFLTSNDLVPVELALAVLFFLAAGGLAYLFYWRRIGPGESHRRTEWENLGERSPQERDVPPAHDGV